MSQEQPPIMPQPSVEAESSLSEQERAEFAVKEIRRLGIELGERKERLHFTGIEEAAYAILKEDEEFLPPGRITPIDELIERLKAHGMKVALNDDTTPGSDTWLLPSDSTDAEMDMVLPRHLKLTDDMDPELRALCLHSREYAALSKSLKAKK